MKMKIAAIRQTEYSYSISTDLINFKNGKRQNRHKWKLNYWLKIITSKHSGKRRKYGTEKLIDMEDKDDSTYQYLLSCDLMSGTGNVFRDRRKFSWYEKKSTYWKIYSLLPSNILKKLLSIKVKDGIL